MVCLQGLVHELSLLEAHPPLSRLVVLIDTVGESDSHLLTQLRHVLAQQICHSSDEMQVRCEMKWSPYSIDPVIM